MSGPLSPSERLDSMRDAAASTSDRARISKARKRASLAFTLVQENRWQEALDAIKIYGKAGDEAWLTNLSARILMSEHLLKILDTFERACTKLDTPLGLRARTRDENLDQTGILRLCIAALMTSDGSKAALDGGLLFLAEVVMKSAMVKVFLQLWWNTSSVCCFALSTFERKHLQNSLLTLRLKSLLSNFSCTSSVWASFSYL